MAIHEISPKPVDKKKLFAESKVQWSARVQRSQEKPGLFSGLGMPVPWWMWLSKIPIPGTSWLALPGEVGFIRRAVGIEKQHVETLRRDLRLALGSGRVPLGRMQGRRGGLNSTEFSTRQFLAARAKQQRSIALQTRSVRANSFAVQRVLSRRRVA